MHNRINIPADDSDQEQLANNTLLHIRLSLYDEPAMLWGGGQYGERINIMQCRLGSPDWWEIDDDYAAQES